MTLVELSARVGVTVANLSILKNGHDRAIRFSTLTAICHALGCIPGELLSLQDGQPSCSPVRENAGESVAASP
ncbi:helix-turn-helix domain-containing protein [Streptosporangium sp. CA-115845]|uniref:helix-turn-helix domain-containing protein n=1 Tax=Streptosporangium sp. CA-115845 TaxID=3240071 RepID=UPI003D8E18FC